MMNNLWRLASYPSSFCFEEQTRSEDERIWKEINPRINDINSTSPVNVLCAEDDTKYFFAYTDLENNLDFGLFPQNESDVNERNKWMSSINFEIRAPFNVLVVKTLDGKTRVKVVDDISKGERLRFKYEHEKSSKNPNWNCMARQIQALVLQRCSGFDCTCDDCKIIEHENYFLLKNNNNYKPKPSTNFKPWDDQLKINLQRAENYKNEIFQRTSRNPLTTNLRHALWDKIELVNTDHNRKSTDSTASFQRSMLSEQRDCENTLNNANPQQFRILFFGNQNNSNHEKQPTNELLQNQISARTIFRMTNGRNKIIKIFKTTSRAVVDQLTAKLGITKKLVVNLDGQKLRRLKVVAEKLKTFSCKACGKIFTRKENLHEHEKNCEKQSWKSYRKDYISNKRQREENDENYSPNQSKLVRYSTNPVLDKLPDCRKLTILREVGSFSTDLTQAEFFSTLGNICGSFLPPEIRKNSLPPIKEIQIQVFPGASFNGVIENSRIQENNSGNFLLLPIKTADIQKNILNKPNDVATLKKISYETTLRSLLSSGSKEKQNPISSSGVSEENIMNHLTTVKKLKRYRPILPLIKNENLLVEKEEKF